MIIQLTDFDDLSILRTDWGVNNFDLTFAGSDTGATQTVANAPMRRTCTLVSNEKDEEEGGARWSVLVHALRGRVNQLAVYNTQRPQPRGTARGVWTAAAAAAGASTLTIAMGAGQAGATLRASDLIGVGQASAGPAHQLLHVQADAVADEAGVMVVVFEPVLRLPLAAGAAVVWDRPTCLMRRTTSEMSWALHPGELIGGFGIDLMESWE